MITLSPPSDVMDFFNPLQHWLVFCDSKDVESIPCVLPAFFTTIQEEIFSICN